MSEKMLMLRFRRGVAVDPDQCAPQPTRRPPDMTEEQRKQALEEAALTERCRDGDRRQPD
jgi:hypothetical protein